MIWGFALVLILVPPGSSSGQNVGSPPNTQLPPNTQPPPIELGPLTVSWGLNVVPVFEGWEQNADGTFNLVFAYLNRNYDEEVDIPIGPNNSIEPGGPDRGQPSHFYPRRNRFVFRVKVPKDWGNKDVVWTLNYRGRTEKAYGSLLPVEIIDPEVVGANFTGSTSVDANNKPPTVTVEGPDKREIRVGEPLTLIATAKDDGIPKPKAAPQSRPPGRREAEGLRVSWITYRGGAAKVTYDPVQALTYSDPRSDLSPWKPGWMPPPLPADGRIVTRATFTAPGTYVLRVMAHDGFDYGFKDVAVTVLPSASAPPH
jgi:hypothetical protein